MAGIDEIIRIIDQQQKQTGESIIAAAGKKAEAIAVQAQEQAEKAYAEHMKKAREQALRETENACSSADAEMKRKILACKVELIDEAIEKTVAKLKDLPDKEYFELLARLAGKHLRSGEGVISLSEKDMKRVPADFIAKLSEHAAEINGTIKLSKDAADIEDGFILSYGLISENCSFRAVIEAETEEVRDIAARELFGQGKA